MREPPRATPEEVFRALQVAKLSLHEREVVFRRGVKGARVVLRRTGNGLFEIRLRLGVASVLREPHAHREIGL